MRLLPFLIILIIGSAIFLILSLRYNEILPREITIGEVELSKRESSLKIDNEENTRRTEQRLQQAYRDQIEELNAKMGQLLSSPLKQTYRDQLEELNDKMGQLLSSQPPGNFTQLARQKGYSAYPVCRDYHMLSDDPAFERNLLWQYYPDILPKYALHQECGYVVMNDKVILVGGATHTWDDPSTWTLAHSKGDSGVTIVDVSDADPHKWTYEKGPRLPYQANHPCAVAMGTTVHITGGCLQDGPDSEKATTHHYSWDTTDPDAGWVDETPLPDIRCAHACAKIDDSTLAIIGGSRNQLTAAYNHNTTYFYNVNTKEWTRGPDIEQARDHINAVAAYGSVYIFGGKYPVADGKYFAMSNTFQVLRRKGPKTGGYEWETLQPARRARSTVTLVAVSFKKRVGIAAIGGELFHPRSSGGATTISEFYDLKTDDWSCLPSMFDCTYGGGSFVRDKKIYILGGAADFWLSAHRDAFLLDLTLPEAQPFYCFFADTPVSIPSWRSREIPRYT